MAIQNKGIIEHFPTEEHERTHARTHTHTHRTTVDLVTLSRQSNAELRLRRQQAQWVRKDRAEGLVMGSALFRSVTQRVDNNPEERSFHVLRGRILQSRKTLS